MSHATRSKCHAVDLFQDNKRPKSVVLCAGRVNIVFNSDAVSKLPTCGHSHCPDRSHLAICTRHSATLVCASINNKPRAFHQYLISVVRISVMELFSSVRPAADLHLERIPDDGINKFIFAISGPWKERERGNGLPFNIRTRIRQKSEKE